MMKLNIKVFVFFFLLPLNSRSHNLETLHEKNINIINADSVLLDNVFNDSLAIRKPDINKLSAKNLSLNDLLSELSSMEKSRKHLEIKRSNMIAQTHFFDYMIKDLRENYSNVPFDVLFKKILACKNFFVDFKVESPEKLFNDCLTYVYQKKSLVQIKLVSLEKELDELRSFIVRLYLQLREVDLKGLIFPFGSLDNLCLVGLNLESSYLPGAHLVETDFSNANLSYADLQNADMSFARFNNSILKKAYLADAVLHGASFVNSVLNKACLTGTNLMSASFSNCDLQHSDFRGASCLFTKFNESNLSFANLQDIFFGSASFVGCCLRNANLSKSRFLRANLMNADLRGADLSGADLSYANLEGAILDGANLENVILNKTIGVDKYANTTKILN